MRDSMVINRQMWHSLKSTVKRSGKDALALMDAIEAIGLDEIEPQIPDHLQAVWDFFEPQMQNLLERYKATCKARSSAGKASGEARRTNANKTEQSGTNANKREQSSTKRTDYDYDNECLLKETLKKESTLTGTQEKIKKTQFKKPALDEIKAYAVEQNIALDANAFFDYYEAKGWKVGNAPMKDWQAAVRNWARNDKQFNRQNQTGYAKPGTESSYGRYIGKH